MTATEGEFRVLLEDGASVIVRYRGKGPRLIMSHGNGLAIDAYRAFWEILANDYQAVVFDFRHHGRSTPYAGRPMQNWPQFIADLDLIAKAIDAELGPAPTFGVFHSMSATTSLLHAAAHETPWLGLVLFEPPVPPPAGHQLHAEFFEMHAMLADGASRRRTELDSVEDLVHSFRSRNSFKRLDEQALLDLVASTLRLDAASGKYRLACDRNFEAETFKFHHVSDPWRRALSVKKPLKIIAGRPSADENQFLYKLVVELARTGNFPLATIDNATHFLQMEHPAACAAEVDSFVKEKMR